MTLQVQNSISSIAASVRTIVAISLQTCRAIMQGSWAYTIEFDESTISTSAALNINLRVYCDDNIEQVHLIAVPILIRHNDSHVALVLIKVLEALDCEWKDKTIGVISNNDNNYRSTADHFVQVTGLSGIHRMSYALYHQLDVIVQNAVTRYFNNDFYSTLIGVIGYLRRQPSLTKILGSNCPEVATTRWVDLSKASKWILANRMYLIDLFSQNKPKSEPSKVWWIHLAVCNATIADIKTTSSDVTTLASQQQNLDRIKKILLQQIGARPTSVDPTTITNSMDNILKGGYVVNKTDAEALIKDCGIDFEELYQKLSKNQQIKAWKDTAVFLLSLIDDIQQINVRANGEGSQVLPHVAPHQLVNIRSHEFNAKLNEQSMRYTRYRSKEDFQQIQEDHRELIRAYQSEPALRDQLQKFNDETSFNTGWQIFSGRFEKLKEFCGTLATLLPSNIESDFSASHYERKDKRTSMTDLSLEGILHSKQFLKLKQLKGKL